MKKIISSLAVVSALLPSLGHAAIHDEATVAKILGTRMPPSEVRVGKVSVIYYNSVYNFDNILNITNRVLDRSIRADIVRNHTNLQNGQIAIAAAKRNQQAVEAHCQLRLEADGIKNASRECGAGLLVR